MRQKLHLVKRPFRSRSKQCGIDAKIVRTSTLTVLGNQTRSLLIWNPGLCTLNTSCCGNLIFDFEPGGEYFTFESLLSVWRSRIDKSWHSGSSVWLVAISRRFWPQIEFRTGALWLVLSRLVSRIWYSTEACLTKGGLVIWFWIGFLDLFDHVLEE